jgi:hypothetical protein
VDETVIFKGELFSNNLFLRNKQPCIKTYTLYDMTGNTYDMRIYYTRDRQNATQKVTAIHVTVRSQTRRVEGVCHKIYIDNFFYSPDIFDDLRTRGINRRGGRIFNKIPLSCLRHEMQSDRHVIAVMYSFNTLSTKNS